MKHLGSVFTDEQELLQSILNIHNEGQAIECDPMYNKGMFYKKLLEQPKYKYDLEAITKNYDCEYGDASKLPLNNNFLKSLILDPPFMFGTHGQTKNNVINKRYTMFDTFEDLVALYTETLKEAYRTLKKNGLLIFKCQDYTDSRTTMTHVMVYNIATKLGFYAKDIAILVKKNKIFNGNLKQRHLRKVHSYFWIFIKK